MTAAKPTVVRLFEGNPGKRPLPEGEPEPPVLSELPEPPSWLPDKAKDVWRSRIDTFFTMKLVTAADLDAFGRWCDLFSQFSELSTFLSERGLTYGVYDSLPKLNKDGTPQRDEEGNLILERQLKQMKVFPQARLYQQLATQLRMIEAGFGMNPASRTKINTNVIKAPNQPRSNPLSAKFKYGRTRHGTARRGERFGLGASESSGGSTDGGEVPKTPEQREES